MSNAMLCYFTLTPHPIMSLNNSTNTPDLIDTNAIFSIAKQMSEEEPPPETPTEAGSLQHYALSAKKRSRSKSSNDQSSVPLSAPKKVSKSSTKPSAKRTKTPVVEHPEAIQKVLDLLSKNNTLVVIRPDGSTHSEVLQPAKGSPRTEQFKSHVGGWLECSPSLVKGILLVFDEEGIPKGKPENNHLGTLWNHPLRSPLLGNVVVIKASDF